MKILNEEEREKERPRSGALYSEVYVVDFYRKQSDGFWKPDKVTYYSTVKGAHKQVLKRFKSDFRIDVNITSVTYQ
jgi:hypothetical protein